MVMNAKALPANEPQTLTLKVDPDQVVPPEPQPDCCPHIFAPPWNIPNTRVIVMPRICCRHGEMTAAYLGADDLPEDHGPYVSLVKAAVQSKLVQVPGFLAK